ncbi:MAG: SDR family NAD(P)-dependent oxidoreductase [Bacteroidales bacterium]|nr:SDR family NAD(P)-dependent oxidoreductase [Bacteroidales bacterium]
MEKTVLITGATSGIGKATAIKLADRGYKIIITGRRAHLLTELEKQLRQKTRVLTLNFDVRDFKQVEKSIYSLPNDWKQIDILINNAGLAVGLNPIDKGDINDWEVMIDTNIKGMLYVTKKVLPLMMQSTVKHIINIGSIAGKEVYLNGNVYCATKFAVDALTRSMRIDLLDKGFKVTAVNPGMTETEFSLVRFKGNKERAEKVYEGIEPLKGEDIAHIIDFIISLPPHVNINDIVIMPTDQATASIVNRKNSEE